MARDLEYVVALMSKHPGVKFRPFEIRPANEAINELIAARNKKGGRLKSAPRAPREAERLS